MAAKQHAPTFVWLNTTTLQQSFHQYFTNSTTRSTEELVDLRDTLIPGLMYALRSRQQTAFAHDDLQEIPRVKITEKMMDTCREIVSRIESFASQVPIETSVELWRFLDEVVRQEYPSLASSGAATSEDEGSMISISDYDTDNISSEGDVSADCGSKREEETSKGKAPSTKTYTREGETFEKNTDGTITATYKFELTYHGVTHENHCILPKQRTGTAESRDTYLLPDPAAHKVPRRTDKPWRKSKDDVLTWKRGKDTWTAEFFFRSFRVDTNRYCSSNLSGLHKVRIDPNDPDWRQRYNRFLIQNISRGQSHQQTMRKTRWSQAEKNVLYLSINRWCKKNGLHKFPPDDLQPLTKEATAAINGECHGRDEASHRSFDATRKQIEHAIAGTTKSNPYIQKLIKQAEDIREKMAEGNVVEHDQMYPDDAIVISKAFKSSGDEDTENDS